MGTYVKKISVTTGNVADMSPPVKITYQRAIKNTCQSSTDFTGSATCQAAMTVWSAKKARPRALFVLAARRARLRGGSDA